MGPCHPHRLHHRMLVITLAYTRNIIYIDKRNADLFRDVVEHNHNKHSGAYLGMLLLYSSIQGAYKLDTPAEYSTRSCSPISRSVYKFFSLCKGYPKLT